MQPRIPQEIIAEFAWLKVSAAEIHVGLYGYLLKKIFNAYCNQNSSQHRLFHLMMSLEILL